MENKKVPNSLKELDHALYRINNLTDKIQEMERQCHEEEITEKQYQRLIDLEEESIKKGKLDMQLNVEPLYNKYTQVSGTHDFTKLKLMDKARKTAATNLLQVKSRDARVKLQHYQERLDNRIKVLEHECKLSDQMKEKIEVMDARMERIREYMQSVKDYK